jgi:hypothetical protein
MRRQKTTVSPNPASENYLSGQTLLLEAYCQTLSVFSNKFFKPF